MNLWTLFSPGLARKGWTLTQTRRGAGLLLGQHQTAAFIRIPDSRREAELLEGSVVPNGPEYSLLPHHTTAQPSTMCGVHLRTHAGRGGGAAVYGIGDPCPFSGKLSLRIGQSCLTCEWAPLSAESHLLRRNDETMAYLHPETVKKVPVSRFIYPVDQLLMLRPGQAVHIHRYGKLEGAPSDYEASWDGETLTCEAVPLYRYSEVPA